MSGTSPYCIIAGGGAAVEEACPLSELFPAVAAFAAKVQQPAATSLRTACAVHLEVLHPLEFDLHLEEMPASVVVLVVVVVVVVVVVAVVVAANRIVPAVVGPDEVVVVWGFVRDRLGATGTEGCVCTLVVVAGTNYLAGRTVVEVEEVVVVVADLGAGLHLNLHSDSFVVGIAHAGGMRTGWKMKTE